METEYNTYDECYLVKEIPFFMVPRYTWLPQAMSRTALIQSGNYFGACSAIDGYLLASRIFVDEVDFGVSNIIVCYLYPEEIVSSTNSEVIIFSEMPMTLIEPAQRSPKGDIVARLRPPEPNTLFYVANPLQGFCPVTVINSREENYPALSNDIVKLPINVQSGIPGSFLYANDGDVVGVAGSSPNPDGVFAVHPVIKLARMMNCLGNTSNKK